LKAAYFIFRGKHSIIEMKLVINKTYDDACHLWCYIKPGTGHQTLQPALIV